MAREVSMAMKSELNNGVLGVRVFSTPEHELRPHKLAAGEYGYWHAQQHWVACSPNGHLCNLAAHKVTENNDNTITVTPSIGVHTSDTQAWAYHGWITNGIWTDA